MFSVFVKRHAEKLIIGALGLISLAVHCVPFWRFGGHPLGYDTGFYRRYLIEPFVSLPNAAVPGLGDDALIPRILLDLLRLLVPEPDALLYGAYVFLFMLIPIIFYFVLKPWLGVRGAAIGGLLLSLSPVAYTAYWYFLFKNALGICLMLLAMLFLEKRRFWPVMALDILIALSHKTTAVIYVAMLGVFALLSPRRIKELGTHAILTLLILGFVAFPALEDAARGAPIGVFLGWGEYARLSIPFLIAIALGMLVPVTTSIPKTFLALAAASLAFPILHLPFYERVFVFTDVALAAFAADAIERTLRWITAAGGARRKLYLGVLFVIVGSLVGSLWYQMKMLKPLTSEAEIRRIEEIGALLPIGGTVLTTTDEAPWFEGWTRAHVAAPGMLHDRHNYEDWEVFWSATSTDEMLLFLEKYPRPLYISIAEDYAGLASSSCMKRVLPTLLYDSCGKER